MAVSVAEYLAQRTDVDAPTIVPSTLGAIPAPICPFLGAQCTKLARSNPQQPICTVRTATGRPWIVCTNRLIPAKSNVITPYHTTVLGEVSKLVFPEADPIDIGFRPQHGIRMEDGKRVVLDYVLRTRDVQSRGRSKAILEIQGGGETSSTGDITAHVAAWAQSKPRSNAMLRQSLPRPGTIANNAWKRQLEQMFRKVPLALRFDAGFVLAMGQVLFDYVIGNFGVAQPYRDDWEIALISIGESPSEQNGPLRLDNVLASSFITFDEFIEAIRHFPLPDAMGDPFLGNYRTLANDLMNFEPEPESDDQDIFGWDLDDA